MQTILRGKGTVLCKHSAFLSNSIHVCDFSTPPRNNGNAWGRRSYVIIWVNISQTPGEKDRRSSELISTPKKFEDIYPSLLVLLPVWNDVRFALFYLFEIICTAHLTRNRNCTFMWITWINFSYLCDSHKCAIHISTQVYSADHPKKDIQHTTKHQRAQKKAKKGVHSHREFLMRAFGTD